MWGKGGRVCLNLHRLRVTDVEVLVRSLLGPMLRVLLDRGGALLGRRRLQHHYLGVAVAPRVVGTRHGPLDMGLCKLSQRVRVGNALVAVDAVTLDLVRALGRRVTRGHVRRRGGRQRTRVVQGLGLGARLGILSGTRGSMLRWGLVACWRAGGLGLMNCT